MDSSQHSGSPKTSTSAREAEQNRQSKTDYHEYLRAMKLVQQRHSKLSELREELSPRSRYRKREPQKHSTVEVNERESSAQEVARIGIIASMVPDEILYKPHDYTTRSYEAALMFIDVAGFTNLCERYTSSGRGGPSKLTQVLNSYIGAMVQEILSHNGDVLKFSGDAFLSIWKKTAKLSMQEIVHCAIDCGLVIQKNYGTFLTDVGVKLKVKVAISAGRSHFSIIGDENGSQSSYVIVGQPVWDVKMAQYMTTAGDVLTAASAWMYVNEAEYCTQPCGDGRHTKVLGVGASWKRVENFDGTLCEARDSLTPRPGKSAIPNVHSAQYKEFSLRPAVIAAMRSRNWQGLRRFMPTPVLRAVDNDEPMDFLTEVRRVVVVFLNIIMKTITTDRTIKLIDTAYRCISSVTSDSGGYVNKASLFDKDMMFLVVFGLRGLKHEDEAQKAVLCASHLLEKLVDPDINSISIGITSGTTYCGVVGHVLRREYTVIGPAVNKAARLMMTYRDMVTCDKETFLRSKLDQECFRQMEAKPLKGIPEPGPVYQFSKNGWPQRTVSWRHPILGRNEELKIFKSTLQNAIEQYNQKFTRYRDHKFAIAYVGPKTVGTTRLLEESLKLVPDTIRKEKIVLCEKGLESFSVIRSLLSKPCQKQNGRSIIELNEKIVRSSIDTMQATPLQFLGMNIIFGCRFPLPETFHYAGDILSDISVKNVVQAICRKNFDTLWVLGIDNGQYIDDESWRVLLMLLEAKNIFLILAINKTENISPVAQKCLTNHMIVNIPVSGVDRFFHAALACQLLDVQAIPADLEKIIESASGGLPGWIQDFVISLVQRGALTIVTVPRETAHNSGAVMPSLGLLQSNDLNRTDETARSCYSMSVNSYASASLMSRGESSFDVRPQDNIEMAVLSESYTFDNVNFDISMDATILKTFDSLNPFEEMLLKCGSVLGEIFSRRMLQHLLQSKSQRKFSEAVAKLFSIRVLECEGGDFTRDTSLVLVHPAPAVADSKPPHCACLGIRKTPSCRDLPMYAFCGYMKFRHSVFRTTTYELLTVDQKHDLHSRALLYLERYTRRCSGCGAGCFAKLLGLRCNSGLRDESEPLKRTRRRICALSAESRLVGEDDNTSEFSLPGDWSSQLLETEGTFINRVLGRGENHYTKQEQYSEHKRVRSFSSLDLENCECQAILQSVYSQVIDHCQGAGEYQKLLEAYMEYADLCINITVNIPQGVRLLSEVEVFIKGGKFCSIETFHNSNNWIRDFYLASVFTLKGVCMLETGDLIEARKLLFMAMDMYCLRFPTSKHQRNLCNMFESIKQVLGLYIVPNLFVARHGGVVGYFYEEIAKTLNALYMLFTECKEQENATLAAKWSLNYALRTNSNLRVLCISYGNTIAVYRHQHNFSICSKLEKRALESCRRKRGQLDVTEVDAVCYLYTNIFLFYMKWGKKLESLEFGLSVMHMLSNVHNSETRHLLVLSMLKLLLCDLKIHDMVAIMREFLYMTDSYDLCSETWYHYYAVVILLDTGYCVESLSTCEKFYIRKGDALLRTKSPEAAWNFFISMWLVTIRIGAWERSILWEEKIKQILVNDRSNINASLLSRLIEGLLITLVKEVDNRNIKKIMLIEKAVKQMFHEMNKACKETPLYRPRHSLLIAYYNYIRGKKHQAYYHLNKARDYSKQYGHSVITIWVEHTRNHWKGTLKSKFLDYWCEHLETDCLLDYRDFDQEKGRIIPFTLPLPRELEK